MFGMYLMMMMVHGLVLFICVVTCLAGCLLHIKRKIENEALNSITDIKKRGEKIKIVADDGRGSENTILKMFKILTLWYGRLNVYVRVDMRGL